MVAPNQLEEKFGGTAKNRQVGEYWPPSLPDLDFGVGGKTDISGVEKAEILANPALEDEEEVNDDEF